MRQQNPCSWSAPIGVLLLGAACRGEPAASRAPEAAATFAEPSPPPAPGASTPGPGASTSALPVPASAVPSSDVIASTPPGDAEDPPLLGPDGAPLPQTEEKPSVSSERFRRRMKQLADSILTGDVER